MGTLKELYYIAKGMVVDVKYEEGHVSHRKDGDYKKKGNDWVPVEEQKTATPKEEIAQKIYENLPDFHKKLINTTFKDKPFEEAVMSCYKLLGNAAKQKIQEAVGSAIETEQSSTKNTVKKTKKTVIKTEPAKQSAIATTKATEKATTSAGSKKGSSTQKPKLTAETKIKLSQVKKEPEEEKPTMNGDFELYQGVKQIDNKLRKKHDQMVRKLKDSEIEAIITWKQVDGDRYQEIQRYIRDPENYKEPEYTRFTKDEVIATVKNLDSAFKKTPEIGTNLTVISGQNKHSMFYNSWGIKTNTKNLEETVEELKKHIGETLTNKSYLATAINEKGADGWHKKPLEMRINVPKDKKAIYVQPLWDDFMEDGKENELLINRGATYKLDSVKVGKNRAGKDAVLVTMTLVDDGVKR